MTTGSLGQGVSCAVGVAWGFRGAAEVRAAGANMVAADAEELVHILLKD